MTFDELLSEKENIKFKIKSVILQIAELKQTYFPGKSESEITSHSNTSPLEVIVIKIDCLSGKLKELQARDLEINAELEKKLELIENPQYRWIVLQKITDNGFKNLKKVAGYSYSHLRKIYDDAVKVIKSQE